MYYRRRDPYYYDRPDPGSCLGTVLVILLVIAILAMVAIFIGFYILLAFLIVGAVIGAVCAVFCILKAVPQTVSEYRQRRFNGTGLLGTLQRICWFYGYMGKNSVLNDVDFAKNFYGKASGLRLRSFKKWMYLIAALAVLACGLLILAALLVATVLLVWALIVFACTVALAALAIFVCICAGYLLYVALRQMLSGIKAAFSPSCYRFAGKRKFSDLAEVPQTFYRQWKAWVGNAWTVMLDYGRATRRSTAHLRWFHPRALFSFGQWLISPVMGAVVIALGTVLAYLVFAPVYLVDAIWIVIRSLI